MGIYGGSPSVTTTTTTQGQFDPESGKRVADAAEVQAKVAEQTLGISQREMEIGEELWQEYKSIFAPYEAQMVEINQTLLPQVAELTGVQLDTAKQDLLGPAYMDEAMQDFDIKKLTDQEMRDLAPPTGKDIKDLGLTGEALSEFEETIRTDGGDSAKQEHKEKFRALDLPEEGVADFVARVQAGEPAKDAIAAAQLKLFGLSDEEISEYNKGITAGKDWKVAYGDAKLKSHGFDDSDIKGIRDEVKSGKYSWDAIEDMQLKKYGLGDNEIKKYHEDVKGGKTSEDAFRSAIGKKAGFTDAQIAGDEPIPPGQRDVMSKLRETQFKGYELSDEVIDEISRDLELNRPLKDIARKLQEKGYDLTEDMLNEAKRDIEQGRPVKDAIRSTTLKAMGLTDKQIAEAERDIEEGRPLKDAVRSLLTTKAKAAEPAVSKFYKEATEGIDVKERMGEAATDVTTQFKGAEGAIRRRSARMGKNVTAGEIKDLAVTEARERVGAMERARRGAEGENFRRLESAMGFTAGIPAPGATVPTGASVPTVSAANPSLPGVGTPSAPAVQGINTNVAPSTTTQYGGYGLDSTLGPAGGFMSSAGRLGYGPSGQIWQTGSTREGIETRDDGRGFGDFLGGVAGIGVGALTGGLGSGLSGGITKKLFGG